MKRVIVIGQPGADSALSCLAFARALSARLGLRHVPLLDRLAEDVHAALQAHDQWIVTEPAGRFTESLFRRAEHVVWLHFSPLDFARDWLARTGDALRPRAAHRPPRARWADVREAFAHLMMAPHMYRLLAHPALAHLQVHELRNRRQAEFWLMSRRRGSGLRTEPAADGTASA